METNVSRLEQLKTDLPRANNILNRMLGVPLILNGQNLNNDQLGQNNRVTRILESILGDDNKCQTLIDFDRYPNSTTSNSAVINLCKLFSRQEVDLIEEMNFHDLRNNPVSRGLDDRLPRESIRVGFVRQNSRVDVPAESNVQIVDYYQIFSPVNYPSQSR